MDPAIKSQDDEDKNMKTLIAGNWKMNTTTDDAKHLLADIVNGIEKDKGLLETCEFLVCPPTIHLSTTRHMLTGLQHVCTGAQDCSTEESGAYTGEISAAMIKDKDCKYVIVGHSERREYHGETDEIVAKKAAAAHSHELTAIICVGEKEEERDAGNHEKIVAAQLKDSIPKGASAENTVIAYEPVWAIGTGKTATPKDAGDMHDVIREKIRGLITDPDNVRILYGGSLKPENAEELLKQQNINGGLIGGASLKAESFLGIAKAV